MKSIAVVAMLLCAQWPQWGGPRRDFTSDATSLATTWPEGGPRRIWSRALGQGHSAISVVDGRLYTMYRPQAGGGHGDEEAVVAIDAATGKTVWERRFASPMAGFFGPYVGPHTTPLVTADRVFAAGSRKQLLSLDRHTGAVVWSRDLIREFGAPEGDRGYAASPLLYKDLLIVGLGGSGQALAAFKAATGDVVWKAGRFDQSPSSPLLIDFEGQTQVVYFAGNAVAGFDPLTGQALWQQPHPTSASLNISTPLWSSSTRQLFISAGYGSGTRVIELRRSGQRVVPLQRWVNNRVRLHFSNAVRMGDLVIGTSGDFGPMFLTAVDARTGTIAWQDRGFARAQLVAADGKLIILDEDGDVALAEVSVTGVRVLARARILESIAWTPPTLVGTTMYVRDRKTVAAYHLGK